MARPRTPTNVLKLRGAFKKDPARGREREDEPIVTEPLGEPPEDWNDWQLKAWANIVSWGAEGRANTSG